MTANRRGLAPAGELAEQDVGKVLAAALSWLHARALEIERAGQVPQPEAEGEPAEGKERQP